MTLRTVLIALSLALSLALASPSAAEHKGPCPANGCGPQSWRVKCIPDRFLGCTFAEACNKHDVCYSQCAACGKRHGENVCLAASERKKLRGACDAAIERDIIRINGGGVWCSGFGYIYKWAVQRFGESNFAARAIESARRGLASDNARAAAIKREMEAIADYAANGGPEIDLERLKQIDPTMEALIEADDGLENRFTTRTENGEVKLEFGKPAPALPRSIAPRESAPAQKREYVNGIDVTNMRVNGRRPDIDGLKRRSE